MVAAMPGVEGQGAIQSLNAQYRVVKRARPICLLHRTQHRDPTLVDTVDNGQGNVRGQLLVGEIRPEVFQVGLDGWVVFGEAEFEANESVHVAIGDVVNDLSGRPAAVPVGRVELGVSEALDGGAEFSRGLGYLIEKLRALLGGYGAFGMGEFADGIAWVNGCGQGELLMEN